jgi:HEAT repeat protein
MRRGPHLALLAAATLVALAADERGMAAPEAPPPSGRELLGAIDFAPSRADLDAAMDVALDELIEIVQDPEEDEGIRLRAIRALSQWTDPAAVAALQQVLTTQQGARDGIEVLQLRAAIEALAEIGGSDKVAMIVPFLEAEGATPEDARDLRATAAKALGVIADEDAEAPLSERQEHEQTDQVKFAITEALRAIDDANP